jgi:hypothetical protein
VKALSMMPEEEVRAHARTVLVGIAQEIVPLNAVHSMSKKKHELEAQMCRTFDLFKKFKLVEADYTPYFDEAKKAKAA